MGKYISLFPKLDRIFHIQFGKSLADYIEWSKDNISKKSEQPEGNKDWSDTDLSNDEKANDNYLIKQPDGSWKEYTLTVTTITNWTYPIIYREWTQPYYPWQSPIIYGNGTGIEHTAEPYKITCDACDSTYNGPRYSENNIIGSRTIFNVEM